MIGVCRSRQDTWHGTMRRPPSTALAMKVACETSGPVPWFLRARPAVPVLKRVRPPAGAGGRKKRG